ncbi:MAG TPA: hypothetical protein VM736_11240 [Gemmatimonadales bacterium]|nr:hypothetical protein [Gemmatimonadales bacterium]
MSSRRTQLATQLAAALRQRRHLLPHGFASDRAARSIARCYGERADGVSAFWIARPRPAEDDGRPSEDEEVFEVLRADGRLGVWEAGSRDEAEVIADALTALSL